MARRLVVAGAQMGAIQLADDRPAVVARIVELLREAHARGATFVVLPELALTTFFPRWFMADQAEVDTWFERAMPGPETAPLFERAAARGIGFHLGYAERVAADAAGRERRFNTAILVDGAGAIVGRYRKVHLPGHTDHEPWRPFQHLEKRYFESGDLGFPTFEAFGGRIGMVICNDRRWPESFRCLGLAGAELVLCGYNTPRHYPPVPAHDHLQDFHNHLSLQAGAYQNGAWVVGVAKAGVEEGCDLIGGSCIVAPTGEIRSLATTVGDELLIHVCDLDACRELREHVFNFRLHREPQNYGIISAPKD